MDPFAESVAPAGPTPVLPRTEARPRSRAGGVELHAKGRPATPSRPADGRVSFDPLQATDRYRLVMPYDQRL